VSALASRRARHMLLRAMLRVVASTLRQPSRVDMSAAVIALADGAAAHATICRRFR